MARLKRGQFPDRPLHGSYRENFLPVTASAQCSTASGGENLWRSRDALREGGRVVAYGFQSKMRGGRMASRSERRHPIRESAELGWFIFRNWLKPGRKSMVPYSIQWLIRFKPAWFRHDLRAAARPAQTRQDQAP
jgi:hypothetical protein